ncbi:MAG: MBL fold metallo-hydrolase [Patescibacteria group bacterium]
MKITKLGHCCLVIEEKGLKILTDPGAWTTAQNEVKDIDVILITHEHADHLHVESVKTILVNNPPAKIVTNSAVAKILSAENIVCEIVEHGQSTSVKDILFEGWGEKHADIYPSITPVQNTGYFIGQRLFYPGDALYNPQKPVDILALPVAGPWLKISEAVDYAKAVKPQICFPVHDGMLKITGPFHFLPEKELTPLGIKFVVIKEGESQEL